MAIEKIIPVDVNNNKMYSTEYQMHFGVDTVDATYYYVGYKQTGSDNWRIKRITKATLVVAWAEGTTGGATAWTNRGSQTYGNLT